MIITIDGPTASGKSTVARAIAKKLNIYYIASGLLFRALGYLLIHERKYTPTTVNQSQAHEFEELLNPNDFVYTFDNDQECITYKGTNITPQLKMSDIDTAASVVATNQEAREPLLHLQRHLAQKHDVIIDGRDCGSVVFPNAQFKFFLTASLQVRAQRWQKLQEKLHNHMSLDQALHFVNSRDERDNQRNALAIKSGTKVIDNSDMNQTETVDMMIDIINKHA